MQLIGTPDSGPLRTGFPLVDGEYRFDGSDRHYGCALPATR